VTAQRRCTLGQTHTPLPASELGCVPLFAQAVEKARKVVENALGQQASEKERADKILVKAQGEALKVTAAAERKAGEISTAAVNTAGRGQGEHADQTGAAGREGSRKVAQQQVTHPYRHKAPFPRQERGCSALHMYMHARDAMITRGEVKVCISTVCSRSCPGPVEAVQGVCRWHALSAPIPHHHQILSI
jgi:hypothetical protein